MLMGEVSMGLTGDEDMAIVPSVLQFLFCFFSLHTNWSMKEVERDTSHKQRPAGHGRGRECSCQDGVDSLSQYFCLCCVPSTHFLQRMKINRCTPETSVLHLLPSAEQSVGITDGPPSVTSPQLSPCKQILSGFRSKSLINKCSVQLCT